MADNIYDLSTTAGSNTTIASVDVSGATGKVKDGDNVMRSLGAYMAQLVDDIGGVATTAGTANAQTVTLASGFTAYAAGQIFRVKVGSGLTNTSSTVTINVNSIGTKTVKVNYGGVLADPIPGDLQAGAYATFLYDGTYLVLLDPQQRAPYPSGHLYGLTLSNGTDATNDVNVAAGTARDGADSANMDLASALGKQLDTAWAVGGTTGTPLGMLATGAAVTDTTYYLFLIKRPDTGVVDFAADTSSSGANIATNTNAAYTIKRLVGIVIRSGGVNGVPFTFPAFATVTNYGHISFPPGQNASTDPTTLDDYEEGTWSPSVAQFGALTQSGTVARYTKIGRQVFVTALIPLTSAGTAGNGILLGALPFTPATSNANYAIGTFHFFDASGTFYAGATVYSSGGAGLAAFRTTGATNNFGINPAVTVASGDYLSVNLLYDV